MRNTSQATGRLRLTQRIRRPQAPGILIFRQAHFSRRIACGLCLKDLAVAGQHLWRRLADHHRQGVPPHLMRSGPSPNANPSTMTGMAGWVSISTLRTLVVLDAWVFRPAPRLTPWTA